MDAKPSSFFRQSRNWGGGKGRESSLSDETAVVDSGFHSRLFWEGMLFFECGSKSADETWSMLWRYQLVDSGQRLQAVEQIRGRGPLMLTTLGFWQSVDAR
jgi:hypothetical protein